MKKKVHKAFALAAFAVLLAGCATTSSETGEQPAAPVKYADANNDGKVTRDEARADKWLSAQFDSLDLNNDDVLDTKEFERLTARHTGQRSDEGSGERAEPLSRSGHPGHIPRP